MKAYQYKQVDKLNDMHMQAWLYHVAGSTKEQGKEHVPVFKNYKEFFDYDKEIKRIEGKKDIELPESKRRMIQLAKMANERR